MLSQDRRHSPRQHQPQTSVTSSFVGLFCIYRASRNLASSCGGISRVIMYVLHEACVGAGPFSRTFTCYPGIARRTPEDSQVDISKSRIKHKGSLEAATMATEVSGSYHEGSQDVEPAEATCSSIQRSADKQPCSSSSTAMDKQYVSWW